MQIRKYAIIGLFAAVLLSVPSSGLANAESIPNWIKTNAAWWAEGKIDQQSFIQGIEYLVNAGIISVPPQQVSGERSESVPDWIKNTATWWATDAISDAEFLKAVEFLVAENIISVQVDALKETMPSTRNGETFTLAKSPEGTNFDSVEMDFYDEDKYKFAKQSGDGMAYPSVVIDEERSAVHVTYADTVNGVTDILFTSTYDNGDSWTTPTIVNEPGIASRPHMAGGAILQVGPNGEIYALYGHSIKDKKVMDEGFGHGYTYTILARSDDGGQTWPVHTIIGDPNTHYHDAANGMLHSKTFESISVREDGRVYVAWLDSKGKQNDAYTTGQVRMAYSDNGGELFSKSVIVKNKVCPCCSTDICSKTTGETFVQYRNVIGNYGEPNYRDIVVSKSDDHGMIWQPPTLVGDDGYETNGCAHTVSSMALDSNGYLHATWYTGGRSNAEGPGLYYAVSKDDAETWSYPTKVFGETFFPPAHIKITIGNDDVPRLAWSDRTVAGGEVYTAAIDPKTNALQGMQKVGVGDNAWISSVGGITAMTWNSSSVWWDTDNLDEDGVYEEWKDGDYTGGNIKDKQTEGEIFVRIWDDRL